MDSNRIPDDGRAPARASPVDDRADAGLEKLLGRRRGARDDLRFDSLALGPRLRAARAALVAAEEKCAKS